MREIIFKGKRKDNNEWIEGHLLWYEDGRARITPRHIEIFCLIDDVSVIQHIAYEVDPDTVGQFTGLYDSTKWEDLTIGEQAYFLYPESGEKRSKEDWKGRKIFEGDIFKFPDEIFESYYTSCGTEYNSWEAENYGVVGFCEDLGRFDFVEYKFNENAVEADLHENHAIEFCDFVSGLEIVGNIHDNPELLRGDEGK